MHREWHEHLHVRQWSLDSRLQRDGRKHRQRLSGNVGAGRWELIAHQQLERWEHRPEHQRQRSDWRATHARQRKWKLRPSALRWHGRSNRPLYLCGEFFWRLHLRRAIITILALAATAWGQSGESITGPAIKTPPYSITV